MSPSTLRRAAAVVASLLLAACAGGDPEPAASPRDVSTIGQPASPSPEPSPTPTEIDVTTIPDEITLEYAQAVIDAIMEEQGEVFAQVLSRPAGLDNEITEEEVDRLFAILEGEALTFRLEELAKVASDESIRESLVPPEDFTGFRYLVEHAPELDRTCLVLVAKADLSGSTGGGVLDTLFVLSLIPAVGEAGPAAWKLAQAVSNADASQDGEWLTADLAYFSELLTTTCGGSDADS
ncbi:MAG: hypothetical protein ACLGIR_05920 [Actinomycetes bacterium]